MGIRSKISNSDFSVASQTGYLKGGFGIVAARQPERSIQCPEQFSNHQQIAYFIKKKFPLAGKFGKNCGCKRKRITLRIPRAVMERVKKRRSNS
jgi:predicted DNA binding CopG/RHH family protein